MAGKSANISVRVEPETKEQAEKILEGLGVSVSAFINMAYRQVILQRGIPFSITYPKEETAAKKVESKPAAYTPMQRETYIPRQMPMQRDAYDPMAAMEEEDPFAAYQAAMASLESSRMEEEMEEGPYDEKAGLYSDEDVAAWIAAFHKGESES